MSRDILFKRGEFNLKSNFDIRIIREYEGDIDLFIDLNYKTFDLEIGKNEIGVSRIQFPMVRGAIIRFNENEYICTIHLLRDIDLHSAFANFEVDYKNTCLEICEMGTFVRMLNAKYS